jgi:hypothetical protein
MKVFKMTVQFLRVSVEYKIWRGLRENPIQKAPSQVVCFHESFYTKFIFHGF